MNAGDTALVIRHIDARIFFERFAIRLAASIFIVCHAGKAGLITFTAICLANRQGLALDRVSNSSSIRGCTAVPTMISTALRRPGLIDDIDQDTVVNAYVDTKRHGPGRPDHTLTLEASRRGASLWTKEITYAVDAPFDVPDMATVDAFVVASIFPTMEVGGTLRVHGTVSRTLIRNLMDYQSVWHLAGPEYCRPFALEVAAIDDTPPRDPGPHPNAILAFTGGMDSMLALCRNASGDAGSTGYQIGATMMILGMGTEFGNDDDSPALIADLKRVSGRWNAPMAVVDTNFSWQVGNRLVTHGTQLVSCLLLFAGRFDVGLLGSSVTYFSPQVEVFGSHPLLDSLLSGGDMAIRTDEGLYSRTDKAALLSKYPEALEDLRVCFPMNRLDRNCCHCEKCIRTMLCFVASGSPVPPAFSKGLDLDLIGVGFGDADGYRRASAIVDAAKTNGTSDAEAMQVLQHRLRTKRSKIAAKKLMKRLKTGKKPRRLTVFRGSDAKQLGQ